MKGKVHAAIGASAPAGLAVMQYISLPQAAVMAAVSAGFALLPDIDHADSSASRILGVRTHDVVYRLCVRTFDLSALPGDDADIQWRANQGWTHLYHRTLTHTAAAATIMGIVALAAAWAHPAATAFLAALGVSLLHGLRLASTWLVCSVALLAALGSALLLTPFLFAVAVTGGYASHVMGDACTRQGVPAFWPVSVQGKRWWRIRLIGNAVISGSTAEHGPAAGVSLAANALLLLFCL